MIKYSRHAMWVSDGVVGRTEKRLQASSGLDLSQAVSYIGEWDREADSILMLADEANVHNNHVNDPTSDTINMSQSAGFNMVRPRALQSIMSMSDHVHVCLCGYTPPGGGGSGDTYLDRHSLTANESIAIAQPVYVSGNNTVNLADADSINTSLVLGLAETAGTANSSMNVLSSGTVTKADWTSVTGSATLTPGDVYYLSTTAGQLTTTPPSGPGVAVVSCGIALTTTKMNIEINEIGSSDLSKHVMTSSGAIVKGTPVFVLSSNTVDSCNADPGAPVPNYSQTYPIGFANSTTTGVQDIEVITEGHIELSDWTAITGSTNLIAGAKYFLDTTEGKISFTAPTTAGHMATRVGTALTTKKLDIEINDGVIL